MSILSTLATVISFANSTISSTSFELANLSAKSSRQATNKPSACIQKCSKREKLNKSNSIQKFIDPSNDQKDINTLTTTDSGIQFLIKKEGLKTEVYEDQAKKDTIGIGHLITPEEKRTGKIKIGDVEVNYLDGITESQAMQLKKQDLLVAESQVKKYVKVPLTQNQFNALVSFTFNAGPKAMKKVASDINKHNLKAASERMTQYNKITLNGEKQVSNGLANRRNEEVEIFNHSTEEGNLVIDNDSSNINRQYVRP